MKITDVRCSVLVVPDCNSNACDSAQDTVVVELITDEGLSGIGETDVNPWAIKALIESPGSHIMSLGLKELVLRQDRTQPNRARCGSAHGQAFLEESSAISQPQ